MSADRESVSLSEPSYFGYLTFEEVPETDVFIRRFFVLNRANARLEYYADNDDWVVDLIRLFLALLVILFVNFAIYIHAYLASTVDVGMARKPPVSKE